MSEEEPQQRPQSVTFNVEYNRAPTRATNRGFSNQQNDPNPTRPISRKSNVNIKTADLSHMTDTKKKINLPTFIPEEFRREVQTPIQVRPGTTTYTADIFPSPFPTDSRQEVENLRQWLNNVLKQNQDEIKDPIQLATNARHWFTIAYEELCRQVSAECPERSALLSSIWKRYQALFARVVQLHNEEKNYLVSCHKERTSKLKEELDTMQAKFKQITLQYRDDQERWSNSRERDETKYTNMKKKFELQNKNKRNLTLQIKNLKDRLEKSAEKMEIVEQEVKPPVEEKPVPKIEITNRSVLENIQLLKQRIASDHPRMAETAGILNNFSKYFSDESYEFSSLDLFPTILNNLPSMRSPVIHSLKWVMSALTFIYSNRLTEIYRIHSSAGWSHDRHYFANFIYQQLLIIYGTPEEASETFQDLVETAMHYSKENVLRCKHFLQFLDVAQPYLDCVQLDFYCYCLSSFLISNSQQKSLFHDNFEVDPPELFLITGQMSCDLAKKIMLSISDGSMVEEVLNKMKEEIGFDGNPDSLVSADRVIDFLMDFFASEECRMIEQLQEQYEMDASQYGGIVTLGQFQTLAMFSSKKIEQRKYIEMMRETMIRTKSKVISFNALVDEMHRNSMLVPLSFERIEYNVEEHLDDVFAFMREEYETHLPEIDSKIERARKTSESLYKQLNASKSKFEQVLETKRIGLFTEVSQRELYEKLRSIHDE